MNDLKRRLAAGEATIGAWLTTASDEVAEIMATLGFHWLAVDMEHGSAGVREALAAFRAAERHGVAPMVRLPSADPYLARRLLDGGAAGLIVPVVEDPVAFSGFIRHCLYPSNGRRGVGLSRCNQWGDQFSEYLTGFSPVIVPQIETVAGVAAAAAIAALPEVDALFLGPYDLSASLGSAGDFTTPAYAAAIAEVKAACTVHGKALGIHQVHPDPQELDARLAEGARFIAYGTDAIAIRHALKAARREGVQ
ncbi:MAG: 2,4-dihydroxyhept-2-ene-1,7-dioic acid aldolase [Rhodospirillaceae bacterium]|nr:2,4-dihydroxyhept-2-ene-1,7-dioic acid aldolase [Rhodospirillales bacterium]